MIKTYDRKATSEKSREKSACINGRGNPSLRVDNWA